MSARSRVLRRFTGREVPARHAVRGSLLRINSLVHNLVGSRARTLGKSSRPTCDWREQNPGKPHADYFKAPFSCLHGSSLSWCGRTLRRRAPWIWPGCCAPALAAESRQLDLQTESAVISDGFMVHRFDAQQAALTTKCHLAIGWIWGLCFSRLRKRQVPIGKSIFPIDLESRCLRKVRKKSHLWIFVESLLRNIGRRILKG